MVGPPRATQSDLPARLEVNDAMAAPVIDKLKLVGQLEDSGFERRHAEGLAQALGEALGEHVLTKADLDEALHPIHGQLVEFAARFDAIDAKFEAIGHRFGAIDHRFAALDAKFEAKFDALDSKVDASVVALGARIDALATNLRIVTAVMLFGFTLLVALGFYNATQLQRTSNPVASPAVPQHQEPAPPNPPPG